MKTFLRFLAGAVCALTLAACGGGGGGGGGTTVSLVGTWSYTDPATMCETRVVLNADGTLRATSLDEVLTGTYTLDQAVNSAGRRALTVVVNSDNGGSDCDGDSSDDTGTDTSYVVIRTNAFDLHPTATDNFGFITFVRV